MNTFLRLFLLALSGVAFSSEPLRIETTLVDGDAPSHAVFQSNNQKVVQNRRGIFLTHIHSRDKEYMAQSWRVSRSTDGGKNFSTIYESTDATNPPALETDSADNLYIGHPDWTTREIVLVRLLAAEDFREAHLTRAPKGAAGKYSMALDEPRGQVCFFAHSGVFVRFGLDGAVRSSMLLLKRGGTAVQEYTHLNLATDGTLHTAWTTLNEPRPGHWIYWGIHHLQSPDGGETWRAFTGEPLKPPIAADETGPSDRITLDDEFEPSTWLANSLVKDGKAHFLYLAHAKAPRQHHVRYDVATGRREIDHTPELRGETIALNIDDGFLAASRTNGGPIFCLGRAYRPTRLACLRSDDNGATWHDHAQSAPFTQPYSIGGCRELTPDGCIIGSFADLTGATKDGFPAGRVHFFRIEAP